MDPGDEAGGVPVATVNALLAGLETLQIDAAAIRTACGLSETLGPPETILPESTWEALWSHAHRARAEPTLALEVGMAVPFGLFGALDYLAGSAPTLGAALESLSQYFRLAARGLTFEIEGDEAMIQDELQTGSLVSEEFTLGAVVGRFAPYLPPDFVGRVSLRRGPADGFDTLLGVPVTFGARATRVSFSAPLETVMRNRDPALHQTMRTLVDALGIGPERPELERAIRARLRLHGPQASGSVGEVAKALGVSSRTLHRRLSEIDRTWQQVVDDFRTDEAERMLAAGTDLTEVALALGFGDASSFSRAFKRWRGVSPSQWRDAATGER